MSNQTRDLTATQADGSARGTPRLLGPVVAAAALRCTLLGLALARSGAAALDRSDTSSYLVPGRNLLLQGRFVADGVPDLVRTPGYPLFLALTSLAGPAAAAIANILLSVFSVLLVWRLARAVTGSGRVALVAAWLFAFEPVSIASSVVLLSETLFLVFFLLGMERLAVFLRGRRLPVLAVAGLWLAAATSVRPVTYYLPIALALGLFAVLVRVPGLRWKAPAVLLICVLPWLAAWQMRNKIETGYGGFTSVSDLNLYFFVAADVTARAQHRGYDEVRAQWGYSCSTNCNEQEYLYAPYLARHPGQAEWTQGQRLAFLHSQAVAILRAHPGVYLRTCLSAFFQAVFTPGAGDFNTLLHLGNVHGVQGLLANQGPLQGALALLRAYPWIAAEKAAFMAVLLGFYLFAARGILHGRLQRASLGLLLGTVFYFLVVTAAAGGGEVGARYRLPGMPLVCILAAAGICARQVPGADRKID